MIYSSLGLLISEQMVRVYDEVGRLYDHSGVHGKWWDRPTENSIDNYIRCYEKQIKDFDEISTEMSYKNSYDLTQRLIIDETVFRQTILSYRDYVRRNGKEFCLVGLNHTSEQLFWINTVKSFLNINEKTDNSYEVIKFRYKLLIELKMN